MDELGLGPQRSHDSTERERFERFEREFLVRTYLHKLGYAAILFRGDHVEACRIVGESRQWTRIGSFGDVLKRADLHRCARSDAIATSTGNT